MVPMRAPVALFISNRPDTALQVFERIARARPPLLFVVADGPRPNHAGEPVQCAAARVVVDRIDWPCQVRTNCSDVNLGCFNRVVSSLDWGFEHTEDALTPEDDCLPEPGSGQEMMEMRLRGGLLGNAPEVRRRNGSTWERPR